jgi:diguanylate cyclase (GGDEF)-like protein
MRLPEININPLGQYRVTTRGGMPLSVDIPHNPRSSTEARAFLQSIAGRDPLTGLTNSHMFAALVDQEIRHSRRYHQALALIIITIEERELSAGSVHLGMDGSYLRAVLAAISPKLRKPDRLARMGDTTLVVLLPQTGCAEACVLAETLRSILSALGSEPGDGEPFPSTRLGVTALGEHTHCLDDLIQHAVSR